MISFWSVDFKDVDGVNRDTLDAGSRTGGGGGRRGGWAATMTGAAAGAGFAVSVGASGSEVASSSSSN